MSDIFISYDRDDLSKVMPLVKALELRKWTVWWDRSLRPGQDWHRSIESALKAARCVIVLWSRNSVESDWVREEARVAKQRRVLVPALIDRVDIPFGFGSIQTADLVEWVEGQTTSEFDELINGISDVLSETAPAVVEPPPARSDPKAPRVNPKDGLTYIWIPPGRFRMGCSEGDQSCLASENPAHEVEITRGFWLGETPVTQAAYSKVMGGDQSHFKGESRPVERVSWDEAKKYCEAVGLRLPTEAEWEYAARAGTTGSRYGALDDVAWYGDNSGNKRVDSSQLWAKDQANYYKKLIENGNGTKPVATKQSNAWGLYDMLGNVWEWVADWYDKSYYGKSPVQNPPGPATGTYRVLRGGSWDLYPEDVRASFRDWLVPEYRYLSIGFRCAGELP